MAISKSARTVYKKRTCRLVKAHVPFIKSARAVFKPFTDRRLQAGKKTLKKDRIFDLNCLKKTKDCHLF